MLATRQTSKQDAAPAASRPAKSMDGIARRQPPAGPILPNYLPQASVPAANPPRPTVLTPARPAVPQPRPQPPGRAYAKPPAPRPKRRRMPAWIEMPLIVAVAMLAGMLAQSALIGQIMVVAYGVLAFVLRVPSRTSFTLALLSMIATIILLTVRGNVGLAQNFATYTFLLLVAGVITLGRELKQEGGRVYSRRNY